MEEQDRRFLRAAIEQAWQARERGDHPFGAVLVNAQGQLLLAAQNTVVTGSDCTAHAETNLMRLASAQYDPDYLAGCTLYTSTEPCPMCAGAIFWGNVGRIVYGLGQEGLYAIIGLETADVLSLPCRELFARGRKTIEVVGPLLDEEARRVHLDFW